MSDKLDEIVELCHQAFDTALDADEERAAIRAALSSAVDEERTEIERLREEKTEIIGIVQRWQPAGSPPPGSPQMLVRWICQTLQQRAEAAEARTAKLVEALRRARELLDCQHYPRRCEPKCAPCLVADDIDALIPAAAKASEEPKGKDILTEIGRQCLATDCFKEKP